MRASEHLPELWSAAEHFIGRHVAEGRGARVAIICDEETVTYAGLDERVRRFAGALAAAGVRPGERVVIVLPDGAQHAEAFWGTLALGAVAVPLNPLLRPGELAGILADCDPRLVVHGLPALDGGEAIVWTAAQAAAASSAARPVPGYASVHRDGVAFILYSSGTTGEPKGVVHLTHDMWVCARTYGERILGIQPDDRCFSVAKLFFAYGLGNAGDFPFDVGASALLFGGRPAPDAVFALVRRHRPTIFFGVPTAYAQMLSAMETRTEADFSGVRLCVSAGEALPASIFERWRERTGLEILDGLGSTEACHIFLSARAGACRPGSTGTPVPGYDVRIVAEDGGDVRRGDIGDLLVRGDSIMSCYWNKHDATERTLVGEWLRTGDKYWQDHDGHFWHAGRSDDMMKCRGQWVSPVEVEGALATHPSVLECAVVGRVDADGLTKPYALIVPRPGTQPSAAELVAFARQRLAPHKTPEWVTFVDELPRTATGKLQRFRLRRDS